MSTIGAQPIYARIAESLQGKFHKEAWTDDDWPTVREVAKEFDVSVVTASRALQVLRDRRGAGAASMRVNADRYAVCLRATPGPYQHAAAQVSAKGFQALGRQSRMVFDFEPFGAIDSKSEDDLRTSIRGLLDDDFAGLFFLPARVNDDAMRRDEILLRLCRDANLPVVLIERNLRGEDRPIENDLVCFNDFEAGRLMTRHLLEQNRHRLAFVHSSPVNSHIERLGGYLSAMHGAGLAPLVLIQAAEASPRTAHTELVDQLVKAQVNGVICYHDYAAVGIIVEMLRRGVRIPADVAVSGVDNMDIGNSFSLGVTTYAPRAEEIAARALDLMRWRRANPNEPAIKVVVSGKLIVRESTQTP